MVLLSLFLCVVQWCKFGLTEHQQAINLTIMLAIIRNVPLLGLV